MTDVPHSCPWIDENDREAVRRTLESRMIAQGPQVAAFERAVAESLGSPGAVATSSGTSALTLALAALEMPSGSEVILPTYTCSAVLESVLAVGAVPVLCDVGEHWNMTPETAGQKRSPRTGAVIVVSTFGIDNPAEAYRSLGVPVVEDRCQSLLPQGLGNSQPAGDVQVYSFHATKCLTTGEGGMAVSDRAELVHAMRALRDGGRPAARAACCHAARMSDLQAALGLSQLARYDRFLARRKSIAEHYFATLDGLGFGLPWEVRQSSIFFRFPLRWVADYDRLKDQFDRRKIQIRQGVDALLHRLLGLDAQDYPGAERLFSDTVSIPIYPALADPDRDRVVQACHDLAGGRGRPNRNLSTTS